MESRFITFRPQAAELQPWISYYYLDQDPSNEVRAYRCFPHLNTSLSIYQSHTTSAKGIVKHLPEGRPLQIYTPIRQEILEVKQIGPVNRIVVVFPPLGIQHFFSLDEWTSYHYSPPFLSEEEISTLFQAPSVHDLTALLDKCLLSRFRPYPTEKIDLAFHLLQNPEMKISQTADALQVSRRHLARLFQAHLGISPKRYREIYVFRQFLDLKRNKQPEEKLISLAFDLGLTDASHLHKLVKKFTEQAPLPFIENGQNRGNEDIFWHEVPNLQSTKNSIL